MTNDERHDRELDALLKAYLVPEPDADFYERALARAALAGTERQRRRWLLTGFGSAIAAGLAAWLVFGFLLSTPQVEAPGGDLPGITIALAEPRTVNLMFASKRPLDGAMLTVTLPDGLELSGFPGQREISWETSLAEGKNLLPLTLVAVKPASGELLARLEHDNQDQVFRLVVDVS